MSAVEETLREKTPPDALEVTLRAHIIEQLEREGADAITFTCPHCSATEFELPPEGQTRTNIIDALVTDGVHFSKKNDADPQCTASGIPFYRAVYLDEQKDVKTRTFKLDEAETHMLEIIRAARRAGERATKAQFMPRLAELGRNYKILIQALINDLKTQVANTLNIDLDVVEEIPDTEIIHVLAHAMHEERLNEKAFCAVNLRIKYAIGEALGIKSDDLHQILIKAADDEAGAQAIVEKIIRVAKQRHGQLSLALEALGAPKTPEGGIDIKAGLEMVNERVRAIRAAAAATGK